MTSLKKIIAATLAAGAMSVAGHANAALATFDIKWKSQTGVDVAFAELTLEAGLINQSNSGGLISIDQIHSLEVTVVGAQVGNGHFSKDDFRSVMFYTASPVNFQQELIGQKVNVSRGSLHYQIGYGDVDGSSGGFGLYANMLTTPTTVRPFALVTDQTVGISDYLVVSSIVARGPVMAVPEPETYALMMLGLGVVALRARRQRRG